MEGAGGSSDSRLTSDGGYTRSWAWLGLRLDL